MAFDLWTHQFCLACDKQTDGATYCSESCRLADYEKTCSTPSSSASSPSFAPPSYPWSSQKQSTTTKFYLSPAYDFSTARPYGTTPQRQSYLNPTRAEPSMSTRSTSRVLTPSSSHSSLCSMQSSSSTTSTEGYQLSEKSKRELHAYHMSFEQVRLQRRRSY